MASVATGHSTLFLDVSLNGQSGNSSSLHIKLWSQANSGFSGFNNSGVGWSVGVPGAAGAGGATSFPSTTVVVWAEFDQWVPHDGNGFYNQTITAHLNATGTSTFGGPADLAQGVSLPRIPKPPGAPGLSVVSVVGRTVNLNATIPGGYDDGGSAVTQIMTQYSLNGGAWSTPVGGGWGARSYANLPPGSYVFRAYAVNGAGNSSPTSTGTVIVRSGGKVWNGTAWVPGIAKSWNGTAWADSTLQVRNGAAWAAAL